MKENKIICTNNEDFWKEISKVWDYKKNKNHWKEYTYASNKKVWIKCENVTYHDSYEIACSIFTKGVRCSFCHNMKIHYLDSLEHLYPKAISIWSDKNITKPYEYAPYTQQEVWWKCENGIHEDYLRRISDSNNYDFRCPYCSRERKESILQEKVRLYLKELNYTVLHEYNCGIIARNPKINDNRGKLPYDNEIPELKLIIEVHGEQHYKINGFHKLQAIRNNSTPEKELIYQQVKDRYKRMYAKSQGYHYLEIPYWEEIDDKYKDIINNIIDKIEVK